MQTYIDVLLQLVIKMKVWNNCIKRSFDYRKTTIKNVDSAYIGKLRGGDWEICNNTMIETNAGRSNNKKQKKKWWQHGYQQDFTAASRWSFVVSDSVQRFDSDLCRGEWQWRRREKKNRRQSLGKNWLGLLNETIKREGIFVRSIKNKWADSFGV